MNQANGQLRPTTTGTARLDLYATGLSTLCLLHCLALPLLASLMPLAAQSVESPLVHRILVLVAVPVSLRVIWKALPAGRNGLFIGVASSGLGLLLLAAFVEAASAYEEPITVTGAVLLGSAHLWHWVRQRGRGDGHDQSAGGAPFHQADRKTFQPAKPRGFDESAQPVTVSYVQPSLMAPSVDTLVAFADAAGNGGRPQRD